MRDFTSNRRLFLLGALGAVVSRRSQVAFVQSIIVPIFVAGSANYHVHSTLHTSSSFQRTYPIINYVDTLPAPPLPLSLLAISTLLL